MTKQVTYRMGQSRRGTRPLGARKFLLAASIAMRKEWPTAYRLWEPGGYQHGFELTMHPVRLAQPLARKKPTVYFVNSMSDLFHEGIPDEFLDTVFSVVSATPQHTYQILTKRAERLPRYFADRECPGNTWLGVSVEDQISGLPRIDRLREVKGTYPLPLSRTPPGRSGRDRPNRHPLGDRRRRIRAEG
jgi:hypothetical protein